MSSYISDVGSLLSSTGAQKLASHSTTGNKDNTTLEMTDFLNLMVVQLQNQSIDSTADTSDMLNQLVQMQMITALTNMTDASIMTYASSLVGKEVTIGDYSTGSLVERVVTVTGTGVSNGNQVIFAGDEVFNLSSVMAVGRLPSTEESDKTEGTGTNKPVESPEETPADKPVESPEETPEDKPVEDAGEVPADKPVEPSGETEETQDPTEESEGGVAAADPVEGNE